jgi:dienelactone hydrolase
VMAAAASWALRLALSGALALTAGLCAAQPAPAPPAAPGPGLGAPADAAAAYSVQEFDWHDSRRNRAVPVRLYWPAVAAVGRPVPLVVFSHGIGGTRRGYSYLGQFWASQGYASLHLQHVGSDRAIWTGNVLSTYGRLQAAAQEAEALARVQDLRFALDQMLAGPMAAQIDASRLIAAGHSYGANTTLLAVGARVEREGRLLDLRDARLKAAIVISAPPFYGEASAERILGGIEVPSLHITATEDIIRVPGYFSPASDRLAVFEATGGPGKALAVFEGGSHNIFSDRGYSGGTGLNAQVKAATQALSMAFFGSVFDGDAQGLNAWLQRFGGLLARTTLVAR